jgi:hypothetical protein
MLTTFGVWRLQVEIETEKRNLVAPPDELERWRMLGPWLASVGALLS